MFKRDSRAHSVPPSVKFYVICDVRTQLKSAVNKVAAIVFVVMVSKQWGLDKLEPKLVGIFLGIIHKHVGVRGQIK